MSAPSRSPLLDLDALMPTTSPLPGNEAKDAVTGIPVYPGQNPMPKALTGYQETNNGNRSSDAIPVIPLIPVEKACREAEPPHVFPVSPAAVALVFAWCRHKGFTTEDRAEALKSLDEVPPGEQVARWVQACQNVGIRPWRVWHSESAGKGYECTGCRFFDSFADSVEGSRRFFHWRCSLGYPVFELWRWAGLMLIAPPECSSFERYTIPDRSG
jgi:hypothetical protein